MKRKYVITNRQRIRRFLQFLSLLAFPITLNYFSPVLILFGGLQGIITVSALTFLTLFVTALIGGRIFCSYLCPAGALMDILDDRLKNKPSPFSRVRWTKFVIWVPWLLGILLGYFRAESLTLQPFYNFESGISIDAPGRYIIYYGVIFLMLIPAAFIGKRAGCHTLCWMSPFMILGRKLSRIVRIPRLQLRANIKSCTSCSKCSNNCPMSLSVMEMVQAGKMEQVDCILCGECIDNCPNKTISYEFSSSKPIAFSKKDTKDQIGIYLP